MKTKHEIMTELIEKADQITDIKVLNFVRQTGQWWSLFELIDQYTRLRAELAEVKDGSAVTWNDVKERYLEFHKMDSFTENMAIDIDFGYWLVNQFAAQSQRMPTEEIRHAFALYVKSEGCSCCRDIDGHAEAEEMLAKLLNAEHYDDGSGYDWGKYE